MAVAKKTVTPAKKTPTKVEKIVVEKPSMVKPMMEKMIEKKDQSCENCNCGNSLLHWVIALLLVLNSVLLVLPLIKKPMNTDLSVALEAIEAIKVGGEENYALVKQIYSSPAFQAQQKAQIEQALKQLSTTEQSSK